MSFDGFDGEVRFAVDAVREAGLLAREVQRELAGHSITKEDLSPVTVADFAVQALVGCMLQQAYPHVPLVAEERSDALRVADNAATLTEVVRQVSRHLAYATQYTACVWIDHGAQEPTDRFWTLDPIDGTKGFLRGDQFAVALALIEHGTVRIGALACPNLDDATHARVGGVGSVLVAARGKGAWVAPLDGGADFRRLRVSSIDDPARARLLRSAEAGHTNTGRIGRIIDLAGVKAEPVRMDSQAKYAVLAGGGGDLLIRLLSARQPDYRELIWDQAAGSIIVEEAGGRVTDLHGQALDFGHGRRLEKNTGVIASNTLLHEAALEYIRKSAE